MTITIRINSLIEADKIYTELHDAGLVNEQCAILNYCPDNFPMDIEVNVDNLMNLLKSPGIWPFKKKISECLQKNMMKVKELARA